VLHIRAYNGWLFECTVDPDFDVMMGTTFDFSFQEEPYQNPKICENHINGMNGYTVRRGKVTSAEPLSLKGLRKRL
tara:strand:- start:146 stop:373 length:228 start_codon:yes stop_codon:yes gene_type:complete